MSKLHDNNNFIPVIGILCIDISIELRKAYGNEYYSYIAASYVKYLESAGAHVIPIWINRPRSYYEDIMSKINGILLPGGAVFFDIKYCTEDIRSDCVQSSKYIYEIAKELSEKGKDFPLWGTCMGMQFLLTHSAKCIELRQDCENMQCSLPIKLESDEVLKSSKLFGLLDEDLKLKMSQLPFGVHSHRYCITKDILREQKIDKQWTVLATNEDPKGVEFINIIEHKSLPFYGSQIHPERVVYEEYDLPIKQDHCLECFKITQYFARFFVHQCNLNGNRFADQRQESSHSIHNFPVILKEAEKKPEHKILRQYYIFKNDVDYPQEVEK